MAVTVEIPYIPSEKQRLFHASRANEVLYGGAAGGGKSVAIVLDGLMRCLQYPGTKAYMFRRTYSELEDTLITEALRWYPKAIARYNVGRHEMTLVNGSKVLFRHCASVKDMHDYAGAEIHWLYIDELTSFEHEIYTFLRTRLRARVDLGITPVVRCGSNPGNIGHGWVKEYFVDAGPYGEPVEHRIYSKATNRTKIFTTQYIPALATDNPHISDDYLYELERKPEALRRALLYGDWDAFEGQVFTEWVDLLDKRTESLEEAQRNADWLDKGIWTHVIKPFPIPLHWPRYMSFDHGFTKPFAVQWWAIGPRGEAYLYREWYGCEPGKPNTGIELSPRQIAEGIVEREMEVEGANNLSIDRIADPSIFERSRGDSVAQQMEPRDGLPGVYFRKGDNARIAGKMQFHERLRFDEEGRPMLQVMTTCPDFIRTFRVLPYDPRKPEDVDTNAEDHSYDAGRYFLMARPAPVREIEMPAPRGYDPFTDYRRRA